MCGENRSKDKVSWSWLVLIFTVVMASGVVGMYLVRFREAYTEMTGMIAGVTMGVLDGLLVGYAAAAATDSLFWGNLFGVLLGLLLGVYYGRPGGLTSMLNGGLSGVIGGAVGAILAVSLRFPDYALLWTAALLTAIYILGMTGLVVPNLRLAPE